MFKPGCVYETEAGKNVFTIRPLPANHDATGAQGDCKGADTSNDGACQIHTTEVNCKGSTTPSCQWTAAAPYVCPALATS